MTRHLQPVLIAAPVMAFIGIAAMAKLTDLSAFALSLETWEWIPAWSIPAISTIVPTLEGLVVIGWVLSARRARFEWLALALLACFTLVYASHAVFAKPPDCQCLGRISAFLAAKDHAPGVAARNGVLMALLATALSLRAWGQCESAATSRTEDRAPVGYPECPPATTTRSGFSLVEALLCVAIVAILLALATPLLGGVRDAARRMASQSNLRQHGSVFIAYTSDYGEQFPYFTDPKATVTVLRHSGMEVAIPYFGVHAFWNFALADYGYDGQLMHPAMSAPGEQAGAVMESYHYACTTVASPEFWNATTRTGPEQWKPTRISAALFPAAKGLLIDHSERNAMNARYAHLDPEHDVIPKGPFGSLRTPTVFIDGHVKSVRADGFLPSYPRGDGSWPGSFPHNGPDPVLHTIDGIRGRDVP